MVTSFRIRAKLLARVAAPILFATALTACSSVPDWVDPTTWIGGDSQASSDQSADAGAPADQSAPADQQAASDQSAAGGKAPDIAAIPAKPAPPSTADDQKKVAESLAADRAQAHYSADALKGDADNAAAPPPATAAPDASTPAATPDQQATADASTPAPSADDQTASAAPPPAETASPSAVSSAPAPASAPAAAPAAAPPPSQVASADTASTSAPAAAPMAPETGAAPDMQASFAASKAPALDPSVSQFVPQQIISRYKETAAAAAVAPPEGAPVRHHHRKKIKTSQRLIRLHYASVSKHNRYALSLIRYFRSESPERFASAQGKSLKSRNLSQAAYQLDPSLFASSGNAALAVVAFTQETTLLDRGARDRIQSAARTFAARGRSGYMRVVGHGASLADNLPRATRFNNFERSEAQATAVARELIRDGVPAEKVVVEAIGNGSPGDHMATGTGPSAEIFLQS